MSYKVKKVEQHYKIFDTHQDRFIEMEFTKKDADTVARKMNLGAGFGDWIPTFFNTAFPKVYK